MPADAAIATVEQLGPLHGVPIAIKDHIPVRGLKGHQVGDKPAPVYRNDHFGVERLRKSGAIIMGTNSMLGAGGGGALAGDRKSVVSGTSVSVRVDLGGRRLLKKTITSIRTSLLQINKYNTN